MRLNPLLVSFLCTRVCVTVGCSVLNALFLFLVVLLQCPVLNPTPLCRQPAGAPPNCFTGGPKCPAGKACCLDKDCNHKCVKPALADGELNLNYFQDGMLLLIVHRMITWLIYKVQILKTRSNESFFGIKEKWITQKGTLCIKNPEQAVDAKRKCALEKFVIVLTLTAFDIYLYIYFLNFFIYLFFYQGTRPGKCPILNPTPVCAKITGCRSDEECLFGSRCCLQQGCKRECVRVEDVPPPPPCELILN